MGSLLYLRTRLANIKGKKGMVTDQEDGKDAKRERDSGDTIEVVPPARTPRRGEDAQAAVAIVEEEAVAVAVEGDEARPEVNESEEVKPPRRQPRERREGARRAASREPAGREQGRETAEREEKPKAPVSRPAPRRPGTSRQLLTQELPEKASGVSTLLRSHLMGEIGVHLTDRGDHYIVDWIAEKIQVKSVRPESPDCMIHLTEQNLLKIASGDLNPQIGMLSDKIRVEGKLSFAVYFFNLLVPRGAQ